MVSTWPSTWSRSALSAIGVKPTQKAVSLMIRWQKSTPTEPWSHNPLGIPKNGFSTQAVRGTKYAQFQSLVEFNNALTSALETPAGSDVRIQLVENDSPAKLWNAINSLGWPASATESAWPIKLYELMDEEYRNSLNIPDPKEQRTTGTSGYTGLHPALVMQTQKSMVTARQAKLDLREAIKLIVPGVK